MENLIKSHMSELLVYSDRQVEKIKAIDKCWKCSALLDHIEIYQLSIKNLLEENESLLKEIKDEIII